MDIIRKLAKMIDHSLLHPTMTDDDLERECQVADKYNVASVCIKPYAVPLAVQCLQTSEVGVGTVIGFPQGNSRTDIKLKEARAACEDGATEIDMVVNIGKVLQEDWTYIFNEIKELTDLVHSFDSIIKVIFENDFLSEDRLKIQLCQICTSVSADFVKTSSGYGMVKGRDGKYTYKGATDDDLKLMRKHCGPLVGIKAAGGIRTLDDLLRVEKLGVSRIGATATVSILETAKLRLLTI